MTKVKKVCYVIGLCYVNATGILPKVNESITRYLLNSIKDTQLYTYFNENFMYVKLSFRIDFNPHLTAVRSPTGHSAVHIC